MPAPKAMVSGMNTTLPSMLTTRLMAKAMTAMPTSGSVLPLVRVQLSNGAIRRSAMVIGTTRLSLTAIHSNRITPARPSRIASPASALCPPATAMPVSTPTPPNTASAVRPITRPTTMVAAATRTSSMPSRI